MENIFISLKKWNMFEHIFLENDGPQIEGRSGGGLGQMAANVINFKKQILGTIIG